LRIAVERDPLTMKIFFSRLLKLLGRTVGRANAPRPNP